MFGEKYIPHYRKNLVLALPVMMSQLGHVLVGVVDSLMVGQLGSTPLAASSLGNSIFALVLTFGIGISYAITPLVAAADSERNVKKIRMIAKHGLILNVLAGFILFGIIYSLSFLLNYMNQEPGVVALAVPYLGIITFSIIPFMFFQTFRQFAEGLSNTKQAMVITLAANVVNIGLNYVLIFGKLGFEPMGLLGAGWATLISRIVMAASMYAIVKYRKPFAEYWTSFDLSDYRRELFSRLLGIGLPSGFQFLFEVGAFVCAAVMIGTISAKDLAAHQIAISLASVSYMMATGISAAATIRVGNQLGRKDIPTLRTAGYTSFVMSAVFMLGAALIFISGNKFFPTLFINEADVIQAASPLIIIAALFQISDGIQVVGLGALRGLTDVAMPTLIAFIAYWILGLPIGYFLGFKMELGAQGVWIGLLIGLTVSAIWLSYRFNRVTLKLMKNS